MPLICVYVVFFIMYVSTTEDFSLKLIFKVKVLKSILTLFLFFLLLLLEHIFWASSWVEEWVVLYDDSTMAWFTVSYSKYSSTPFFFSYNIFSLLNFIHFNILMVCVSIGILYTYHKFN